ncbi:MAG: hypothetical protein JM58_16575 [Peptococcaceae bacterium BICA1-8]|nr:MAG: hypothetical protein JM58_16575 [Peptococcaceae bacterium BICA1-8]
MGSSFEKKNLLLVAPYSEISEHAARLNDELGLAVLIKENGKHKLEDIIHEAKERRIEAIISRGGVALKLKELQDDIPVVEIPVTGFDIIEAIYEARKISKKIAIIGFSNIIQGINRIERIMGLYNSKVYIRKDLNDCEKLIAESMKNDIRVIVGDTRVVNLAKKYMVHGILIKSREEALLSAYEEAERLINAIKQERIRTGKMEAILNNIDSGIIALDDEGKISSINPQAENILGVRSSEIVEKKFTTIFEHPYFYEIAEKSVSELGVIVSLGKIQIVVNTIPIKIKDKVVGTVITLQEVGYVQEVEQKIRNEFFLKGHIAKNTFSDIIGKSQVITQTVNQAKNYAKVNSVILINGETGVGKEIFAQSIHNASCRANGPFVAINCAALPSTLLESELFGYVRGAFTDARKEGKAGLFELAHQGTILLDEITEMPIELQARLLRVLQEKQIIRLGDDKIINIDCRIIATTNRDLEEAVENGKFREDLYYRINILNLYIPPLRERTEDIELLVKYILKKFSKLYHKPVWNLDKDALKILNEYCWPGNIRELSAIIERIIVTENKNVITRVELDFLKNKKNSSKKSGNIKLLTDQIIQETLSQCGGNKSIAAKKLGIDRSTLWRKIKE